MIKLWLKMQDVKQSIKNSTKKVLGNEDGMNTVEIVLILVAVVAIATLFGKSITTFVKEKLIEAGLKTEGF